MVIPEKSFGITQEQLFHIWTAGLFFGTIRNTPPDPDSKNYKEEMNEYEMSYELLLDVNRFRGQLGIDARNLSREDNETLSVLFGWRLARR